MSLKLIPQSALLLVLALAPSGCCTVQLWQRSDDTPTRNDYAPSALYSVTNHESIGIEATLCEEHREGASSAGRAATPAKPRYFLIPVRKDLRAGLSPTNAVPWLNQLRTACPKTVSRAKPRDKLPRDYEKLADLPDGTEMLYHYRHPHAWRKVLTPLTLAVDIATSPIQLILGIGVILTPGQLN